MSIQGPLPPSSVPPGYSHGRGPQLPAYAHASLASQLAGLAPTSQIDSQTWNMGPQEQNTYWFLRMYGDISMIYLMGFSNNHGGYVAPAYNGQYTGDLQFILNQVQKSGTGFDPKLISDLQSLIKNPGSGSANYGTFMANYNAIIQGKPPKGYAPNTSYSFTQHLAPDDMFNFYLIQISTSIYNTANHLPQNSFWTSPKSPNSPSLLASQMGEFMCYYLAQRDGIGTSIFKNDLGALKDLITTPLLQLDKNDFPPGLLLAITGGNNAYGNHFNGFSNDLLSLQQGSWPYGTKPEQNNNTPSPAWDIDPNYPRSYEYEMNYGIDYNFLLESDRNLAQWIQGWQSSHKG